MTDTPQRPPKKSEMLEVRLDYETKRNFLDACRRAGRTASDVVRESVLSFIDRESARPDAQPEPGKLLTMIPRPIRRKRYLAAAAGVAGAAGIALFSALPSAASPDLKAAFQKIDRNGDGVVTVEEFFGDELPAKAVEETRATIRKDMARIDSAVDKRVLLQGFGLLHPSDGSDPARRWVISLHLNVRVSDWDAGPDGVRPAIPPDHPLAYQFIEMDTDRNDVISAEEYIVRFHALLSRGFELLDTDHDGFLMPAEFAFSDDEHILSARMLGSEPDCAGQPCKPSIRLSGEQLAAGFTELDRDSDGRVSLKEYLAPG
jgi:hypothetical protein